MRKPLAFTFASSCSGLDAPVMTEEICGRRKIHASASTDRVTPRSLAILASFSTFSRFSSVSRLLICLSAWCVAREPAGSGWPLRYLPVKSPCASGEKGTMPMPFSAQICTISSSM